MSNITNARLLTVPEAAERLNVSPQRLYELVRCGAINAVRLGRAVRIDPERLQAFIDAGGVESLAEVRAQVRLR